MYMSYIFIKSRISVDLRKLDTNTNKTRCGTQVPRDGRPAEYKCHPLLNAGEQIAKMSLLW